VPSRSDSVPADKGVASSESALLELQNLESDLNELRANFEQYFLGIERIPPEKKLERYKKRYFVLKESFVRQTALKFRIQNLGQKLTTYERLWDKTLKQIEAGTFSRDLKRLKNKTQRSGGKSEASDSFDVDEDIDVDFQEDNLDSVLEAAFSTAPQVPSQAASAPSSQKPSPPPQPSTVQTSKASAILPIAPLKPGSSPSMPAGKSPTPVTRVAPVTAAVSPKQSSEGVLSETKMKAIYEAYVMAKQRCGEDTRSLTYDTVSSTLKAQVPTLMKQHNAKSVEFKVVIKDGKAILRALPKDT
jgi:hypothetical protein